MNTIIAIFKFIFNVVLFALYSLFGVVFASFIYGGYMRFIADSPIPASSDPIHMKIAIGAIIVVTLITLLLKKIFYVEIFTKKFLETAYKKKSGKKINKEEMFSYTEKKQQEKKYDNNMQKEVENVKKEKTDDLEIYVNKEI